MGPGFWFGLGLGVLFASRDAHLAREAHGTQHGEVDRAAAFRHLDALGVPAEKALVRGRGRVSGQG